MCLFMSSYHQKNKCVGFDIIWLDFTMLPLSMSIAKWNKERTLENVER